MIRRAQAPAQLDGHGIELVQAAAQKQVHMVNCAHNQARQADRIRGRQIQGKQAGAASSEIWSLRVCCIYNSD